MNDLLVQSRFRNNIMYKAMNGRSVLAIANELNIQPGTIHDLLNLKISPYKKCGGSNPRNTGNFRKTALDLSSFFGIPPEELFPDTLYEITLPDRIDRVYASEEVFQAMQLSTAENPETKLLEAEKKETIQAALRTLKPQEMKVLNLRFGLNGPPLTLEETSQYFAFTRERIRQIEAKALRILRHPSRGLKQLMPPERKKDEQANGNDSRSSGQSGYGQEEDNDHSISG